MPNWLCWHKSEKKQGQELKIVVHTMEHWPPQREQEGPHTDNHRGLPEVVRYTEVENTIQQLQQGVELEPVGRRGHNHQHHQLVCSELAHWYHHMSLLHLGRLLLGHMLGAGPRVPPWM